MPGGFEDEAYFGLTVGGGDEGGFELAESEPDARLRGGLGGNGQKETVSEVAAESKYDFRYSVLPLVFANLLRDGRISEGELHGLGEDKLEVTRLAASL